IISYLLFAPLAIAQGPKFAVTQEIIYQINPSGQTAVRQNFSFTNLTSDFYPQEYRFQISGTKIEKVGGSDRLGNLEIITTKLGQNNQISIKFNDKVTGLGKILRWSLTYVDTGMAQKQGQLWVVAIPAQPQITGLTTRVVRLIIPETFGKPVFIKPEPEHNDYYWDQTGQPATPILATFTPPGAPANYQLYDYKLFYNLYNAGLSPAAITVALPPDSNYQKSFLNTLSPKPVNVTTDDLGNWLARYELGPLAKLNVIATGAAAIFFTPQISNHQTAVSEQTQHSTQLWPATDPQIQDIGRPLGSAKAINDYVVSALTYDAKNTNSHRSGGKAALLSPTIASAYNFTDLFITLARAKNIPAVANEGYLVGTTTGRQIWPSFYDPVQKIWQAIDPALEKTTGLDFYQSLDLAHLVVWINAGQEPSTLPNEVAIEPSRRLLDTNQVAQVTATLTGPRQITAGFPTDSQVYVENLGPTYFVSQPISVATKNLDVANNVLLTTDLPPFGHYQATIKILPPPWTQNSSDIITLRFGLDTQDYPIKIVPLYKNGYLLVLGGLIFFGLISIITQIARSLSVQKPRRENNLRRQG
ncbi:transglutaminase domain-containing protein, partial [Candidatus Microgenomates bacterium]|nr:transglutaminase domain-containing protein [Candidatus Microgenomates bacterium]